MVRVFDIIGKNIAVSTEDGRKIFEILKGEIEKNKSDVVVSFKGIDMLISHFLNESIGKLYITFDKKRWDEIDSIHYTDIDEDDLELLKERVISAFKGDINKAKEIEKGILR